MTIDTQPRLESARLILRPFVVSDAEALQTLAGDLRVSKETKNIPHPYQDGVAEKWISALPEKWATRQSMEFAIEEIGTANLVGCVSFVSLDGDEAEIGYWIGYPYWRKGFASEAARLLIDYGFTALSLKRITAVHLTTNPGSGKVLQNVGLQWSKTEFGIDRYGMRVSLEFYELERN